MVVVDAVFAIDRLAARGLPDDPRVEGLAVTEQLERAAAREEAKRQEEAAREAAREAAEARLQRARDLQADS